MQIQRLQAYTDASSKALPCITVDEVAFVFNISTLAVGISGGDDLTIEVVGRMLDLLVYRFGSDLYRPVPYADVIYLPDVLWVDPKDVVQ